MVAYLLLLLAVLTRVVPHGALMNFTAVGGALLYFGAKRSWKEMIAPLAILMATDYYLTVFYYHYSFRPEGYLLTWAWYLMAMGLGLILLRTRVTFIRVAAGALLGPTSFFLLSNFAVWAGANGIMYPRTMAGLASCYYMGLPFYRNDLASTAVFLGVAFGVPALLRRMHPAQLQIASAAK